MFNFQPAKFCVFLYSLVHIVEMGGGNFDARNFVVRNFVVGNFVVLAISEISSPANSSSEIWSSEIWSYLLKLTAFTKRFVTFLSQNYQNSC